MNECERFEKYEDKSRYKRNNKRISLQICGLILLGLLTISVSLYGLMYIRSTILSVLMIVISVGSLIASYECVLDKYSNVTLTRDGVLIKYPLHKVKLIKWDEFYTVCRCISGAFAGDGPIAYDGYDIICFVRKGESTNMLGRWRTENPFHLRRLICFYYTDELFEKVKSWCPISIVDLSNTLSYLQFF